MLRVGIDLGGTQLRCAIFDNDNVILDKYIVPNDKAISAQENLDKLIDFIMSKEYSYNGIGIGCPGPVDIKQGTILNPPNLFGWNNFEIKKYVEHKTHIPTKLNNDANVAGLAEAKLGAGKSMESVFYITVSTGVGGAYIFRGEIINGATSTAGEIYNMIVNEDKHCREGINAGSLNEQCGGHGLSIIAKEIYGRDMDAKELFSLYHENDKEAILLVDRAIDVLGKGIANIACVLDPDIFVMGGSIALYNEDFIPKAIATAKKYAIIPEHLHIERAQFNEAAGLIGASLLVD